MLDLLSPMFFYVMGTVGALVPLVLHLIQSRRTVKVPFSTVRFLHLAQERSSSRIRMENWLLWIIRTALLVILALAFAMPMLRGKGMGSLFGRSPRDVAIIIDASYSMDYNLGRQTVWKQAIDTATAIIEDLGEQDRFCIFVARDHVEPLIEQLTGDKDAALSRLKALTFSQTSSQLAPAVMEANEVLAAEETRREREIHIITDTQALPWKGFGDEPDPTMAGANGVTEPGATGDDGALAATVSQGGAMGRWDPEKIDQTRTTFFVSLLGVDQPENLSPIMLTVEPPLLLADAPARATVRLGYSGPARGTTVSLHIDGVEVGTQSILVGGDQPAERVFNLPPLTAGWHEAQVQTPDDNLGLDNVFNVVLRVVDQFPTLCVGSRDDTLFLRAALKAGQGGGIESDWIEPGGLSADTLATYACVFLCNAVPLSGGEVNALEHFVERGGLLTLFPGPVAVAGDYQSWRCLPAMPTGIESLRVSARKAMLHGNDQRHALLAPLRLGESPLSIVVRDRLAWDALAGEAVVILSHGDAPFLAGRSFGRGYVLLFTVSADRRWSDFPLSPFYLPIIHQIVAMGAGLSSHPPFVWCTDNLPLSRCLPEARHDTVLASPDGSPVPVRSALVGVNNVLHLEDLDQAGIYRMTPPDGGPAFPALAVNMPRDESDLAPLTAADIAPRLGVDRIEVARDLEALRLQIKQSRVGRTFGEPLLWVVLVLAALEFLLANRLSQETPTLTGTLGIEASGHVPAVHTKGAVNPS